MCCFKMKTIAQCCFETCRAMTQHYLIMPLREKIILLYHHDETLCNWQVIFRPKMHSPSPICNVETQSSRCQAFLDSLDPFRSWLRSHQVFIQAVLVWAILCLPGNIVTFTLYRQVHLEMDVEDQVSTNYIWHIVAWLILVYVTCRSMQHLNPATGSTCPQTIYAWSCHGPLYAWMIWCQRSTHPQDAGTIWISTTKVTP